MGLGGLGSGVFRICCLLLVITLLSSNFSSSFLQLFKLFLNFSIAPVCLSWVRFPHPHKTSIHHPSVGILPFSVVQLPSSDRPSRKALFSARNRFCDLRQQHSKFTQEIHYVF